MAQTRPLLTLSREFTRLGRFLAPYWEELLVPEIDRQQDSIVDASVVLTGVSGRSSVDVSPRRSLERLVYPSRLDRN